MRALPCSRRVCFSLALVIAQLWLSTESVGQVQLGMPAELKQEIERSLKSSNQPSSTVATEPEKVTPTVISRPPVTLKDSATSSLFVDYANREFSKLAPTKLTPFGYSLVQSEEQSYSPSVNFSIPDDYQLAPGDEVIIRVWGSFETGAVLKVDRRGFIKPPMIGEIQVSGMPYGSVERILRKSYGKVYQGFELSVTMGRLRGIRVYVTGFSRAPGSYFVSNLTTLVNLILTSGGPGEGGSFRSVDLIRQGQIISEFDLYDLLLRGNKTADLMLRPEDIIHIRPKMREAAIAGSVYRPGIYELKEDETLGSLLEMAGGLLPIANKASFHLLSVDRKDKGFEEVSGNHTKKSVAAGDLYYILDRVSNKEPTDKKKIHVKIGGEVRNPGLLLLPPGSTLRDAVNAAGGLSENAFLFGSILSRGTVRDSQEKLLAKARQDARIAIALASTRPTSSEEETLALERQIKVVSELLAESTKVPADGRIVLKLGPKDNVPPTIKLEDGDSLVIPTFPSVMGVFGSVVNPGTFEYSDQIDTDEIIALAGGPSQGADLQRAFIISANGQIRSPPKIQTAWLGKTVIEPLDLSPGDVVYVPNNLDPKFNLSRELKDWSLILSQLVTATVAIKVLGQ